MTARAGTNFFMTSKRCWFYTCLSSRTSWGSLEFFKGVVCFEKQAYSTQSEFWICGSDTVFWCIGECLRFFRHQTTRQIGTYRLALADCLLTNLPFLYYTSMDMFSVETESAMAHGKLHNASVFNKIRLRNKAAVRKITVISQAVKTYFWRFEC